MSGYEFVEREKAHHPVRRLCRALGVSPSGYWAWRPARALSSRPRQRPGAPAQTSCRFTRPAGAPMERWGCRPSSRPAGWRAGTLGWRGSCAGRAWSDGIDGVRCAGLLHDAIPRPRQPLIWSVQRSVAASAPDQLWIADSPYLPTEQEGVLYLAVILDGWSRRVVGWSMQEHLRTGLVLAALEMAVYKRRPAAGLIQHCDHGCQYTSVLLGQRCAAAGIRSCMGTVGDCFDNAMVKSFFAPLECALLTRYRFRTHAGARAAVFDWIEIFSNRQRRHSNRQRRQSALGYGAPAVDEQTLTTPTSGAP